MGILSKKSVAVATGVSSFEDRLKRVKSMFRSAYDEAGVLNAEMQMDIEKREERIKALREEINNIQSVQNGTQEFMSNLEKFI